MKTQQTQQEQDRMILASAPTDQPLNDIELAALERERDREAAATPAQASGNCQASHSPFICPICKTEQPAHHTCSFPRVETGEGMKGVSWKDYWTLQAHAQRLAAFAKSVAELDLAAVDCGMIPTDTWKRIHAQAREALAQYNESPVDADALEALDQLEQLEGGE